MTSADAFANAQANMRGLVPILVTPFDTNDEIDVHSLDRQIDFLHECGVRWVGVGFGSEIQRLSSDEARLLVERPGLHSAGSMKVIGNADATSIPGARATIEMLAACGGAAVLLRPPALGGLDDTALFDAFFAVAHHSPLPVIVQDAGAMTGTELSVSLLTRLISEIPEIVAVKVESREAVRKIAALRPPFTEHNAILLGGSGGAEYLWELDRGVDGTMPGPATPHLFTMIATAFSNKEHDLARRAQRAILPLLVLGERNMDTFVYSQKYILQDRGIITNKRLRSPNGLGNTRDLDRDLRGIVDDLERANNDSGLRS